MKLLRLGLPGSETPAVLDENGMLFDLSPLTADIDGAFLASRGIERVRAALDNGDLYRLDDPADGTGQRIGAPVARPGAVICIGTNYAAHARESGAEPPRNVIVFYKHPNTIIGPYDDVAIPPGSSKTDWEVELALVIGSTARYLPDPATALAHIAGFTISNDISEREQQLEVSGGQWSRGKSFETFNPLGPWLVPTSEIGNGSGLRLWSTVNGEARQDSTTSDLIFGAARLVHELSQFMVLEPGDIINTGTPEGVALSGRFPYLNEGDVYEGGIERLGQQRQLITRGKA